MNENRRMIIVINEDLFAPFFSYHVLFWSSEKETSGKEVCKKVDSRLFQNAGYQQSKEKY